MKKKLFLSCALVLLFCLSSVAYFTYKSRDNSIMSWTNKSSVNNFYVLFTSFTEPKSIVYRYKNVIKQSEIAIEDIALENLILKNESIFLSSRYSGHFYSLDHSNKYHIGVVPSGRGITNSFSLRDDVVFITNGGLLEEGNKQIYRSGLLFAKDLKEINYDIGFFTSGVAVNDSIYILNFNPAIKKEQILILSNSGDLVKTINLGDTPLHNHKSMISFNDKIYLFSKDHKLRIIDNEGNIKLIELDLDNTKKQPFRILKHDNKIFIIYDNGDIAEIIEDRTTRTIKLEHKKEEYLINVEAKVDDQFIYILYSYDRAHYKKGQQYEGVIHKYSLRNGQLDESLYLPLIPKMRVSSFDLISN